MRARELLTVTAASAVPALVLGAWGWTRAASRGRVVTVDDAPHLPWAVVLGAGVNEDLTPQNALRFRLDLGAELYHAGRCDLVLVSGGVRGRAHEPAIMRRYLLDLGVPETAIVQDCWGDNTFNSARRAARVFGIERALVVTQEFHVFRAVALFREAGVDAYGVADQRGRLERRTWVWGTVRELGSNVKALTDIVIDRPYLPHGTARSGPTHTEHREQP